VAGLESIRGVSAGYAGLVAGALQRAWVDRPTLPRGVGVLRVVARFRVQRDGHIEAIELSLPSGYTLLDQSVLRTLRGLDRLPGFPPSIKQGSIDAEFVFELQPTESPN
jgi:TonB family protein